MSISFQCGACGRNYSVSPHLGGKAVKCKQCGARIEIPETEPAPAIEDIYGLDEPSAPAEPMPMPGRSAPGPTMTWGAAKPSAAKTGKGKVASKAVDSQVKGHRRIVGVLVFLLIFGVRIGAKVWRGQRGNHRAVASRVIDHTGPIALPTFPESGPGREIEDGIQFHSIAMGPQRPGPNVPPGHGMRLWLYLPAGDHAPGSLPCVLIAPAGSILITGNELDAGGGDHPEHLPYARAGFAVLAYGLDGELGDVQQATDAKLKEASETFLAARAGLVNAEIARKWLLAKVPQVDPARLYAAGHSSAGTMALLLAEHEPTIRGCVAFAPRVDISKNFDANATAQLRGVVPDLDRFFTTYNPKTNEAKLNCPVFLFHARDDNVVPIAETEEFANELRNLGKTVAVETVDSGGHYQSMIAQGIPRAIPWLCNLAGVTPTAPARNAPRRPKPAVAPPKSGGFELPPTQQAPAPAPAPSFTPAPAPPPARSGGFDIPETAPAPTPSPSTPVPAPTPPRAGGFDIP